VEREKLETKPLYECGPVYAWEIVGVSLKSSMISCLRAGLSGGQPRDAIFQ
jgi:hypothetical protein